MRKIKKKLASYASVLKRINSFILDRTTRRLLFWIVPVALLIEQAWVMDNYLLGEIVNRLSGQKSLFTQTTLVWAAISLVGWYALVAVGRYLLGQYGLSFQQYLTNKTESQYWRAIAKLELQDRENPDIQNAISDAQRNYNAVTEIFGNQMTIFKSVVTLCAAMLVLGSLEWWYTIIIILMVIPGIYLSRIRRIKNYYQQKSRNEIQRYKYELSSQIGTKETILHGATDYFLNLYQSLRSHFLGADTKHRKKLNRLQLYGNLIRYSLMGILYYAVFLKIEGGFIQVGSFFLVFSSIKRLESNLESILDEFVNLEQKVRESNDFFLIIDMKPSIPLKETPVAIDLTKAPSIEFDNVWFKYPGAEESVLKGVSFKIESGERIGLIGENGSGKTTISLLMLRFYDPNKGSIRINGIDLRLIDRNCLFSITGAVFQDFELFETRISETIRVSAVDKKFDIKDIKSAAQKVDIDTFIQGLPSGYNHKIGRMYEGGIKLSGGQKQKVAIAGLLYRDPKLVILDELTSALSPTAEQQIIDQYEKVVEGKTCLVICHRYKSLQFVHRIMVIDEGVIVENGTHKELISSNGMYSKLYTAAQLKVS
ncbi:MAG: ABC transporter ATP-binding protein [Candidatus Pacebacteria bacterium]|nr:ABC transporter ATP-binding protein [Candidatus Paceibacterota bacterium]MBP9821755.1 ABC transporter ATP-binding protein [Candidatus Paceibacterota bacterium]